MMKTGDMIRMRNFSYYEEDGSRFDYTAPKGEVFIAVLLGTEKKDGTNPLDHKEIFEHLSYIPDPELVTP